MIYYKIKSRMIFLALPCIFLFVACSHKTNGGGESITYSPPRETVNSDIWLFPGYSIEPVATALNMPSDMVFDEEGKMYILEAGYSGKEKISPRLVRYESNLNYSTIALGGSNGAWTGMAYFQGDFYISEEGGKEGGKILKVTKEGTVSTLLSGLPKRGDYGTSDIIVHDGYIYFAQGSASNAGVLGADNTARGNTDVYDIPCEDVELSGQNFKISKKDKTQTGGYAPYGSTSRKDEIVKAKMPCTGSIMRIPLEGGKPELVAWGFRNPNGMAFNTVNELYVTENGYDERGSRPVANAQDYLWKVNKGKWHGFPDYSGGESLDQKKFKPSRKSNLQPLLDTVPNQAPTPVAPLGMHTTASDMAFSITNTFGFTGSAFVALFGDMSPWASPVEEPRGFKVVRVDVKTGETEDFVMNVTAKGDKVSQPASKLGRKGLERPIAIQFSPLGREMYIIDYGVLKVDASGTQPVRNTGVVWKVRKN